MRVSSSSPLAAAASLFSGENNPQTSPPPRKRKRIPVRDKCSDDSDEDYVAEQDASDDENSEESLAVSSDNFSEESFDFAGTSCSSGGYGKGRKAAGSKSTKAVSGRRKSGPNPRKGRASGTTSEDSSEESCDMVIISCSSGSDGELKVVRPNPRNPFPGRGVPVLEQRNVMVSTISEKSENSDSDFDDGDEDDEEFMPDVDDCIDEDDLDVDDCFDEEEEKPAITKRNGMRNQVIQRKGTSKNREVHWKPKKQKKEKKKKKKKKATTKRPGRAVSRRPMSSDDDFVTGDKAVEEKNRKKGRRRKKRLIVHSDSDIVDSESSDYDYTIFEEERELIREASNKGNLIACSRRSPLSEGTQVNGALTRQQLKMLEIKGKAKTNDLQLDTGKQVCGICLSEEREGIVRGILNSCFHYFCFNCIMEWSKVESRCPLCKRRFTTLSKPARPDIGIGLRNAVIRVPIRDQVYQPSEEEMRGYLDPYENVVCMECQQGGDDNLMLLCDICDSSAHTYCVGLGREIPEGNWYCEGCKASELRPADSQAQDSVPGQDTSNSVPCPEQSTGRLRTESFDLNACPFTTSQNSGSLMQQLPSLVIDTLPSPRFPIGEDPQAASPLSGGASTVSERRRLRLRIHHLITNNRMSLINERGNPADVETIPENNIFIPEVEPATRLERGDMHSAAVEGRAQDLDRSSTFQAENYAYTSQNGDSLLSRLRYERNQVPRSYHPTSSCNPTSEILYRGHGGISPSDLPLGFEQWGRHANGLNLNIPHCMYSEGGSSHAVGDSKDQVRAMVKSQLKLLSNDVELGREAFKEIARQSTHTILAACGIRHNQDAAMPIEQPPACPHIEKGGEQTTLMKGYCTSCFNSFGADVVMRILRMKLPQ
ncbi:hypothetical protein ACLOJK_026370 [Asimina triloba]